MIKTVFVCFFNVFRAVPHLSAILRNFSALFRDFRVFRVFPQFFRAFPQLSRCSALYRAYSNVLREFSRVFPHFSALFLIFSELFRAFFALFLRLTISRPVLFFAGHVPSRAFFAHPAGTQKVQNLSSGPPSGTPTPPSKCRS